MGPGEDSPGQISMKQQRLGGPWQVSNITMRLSHDVAHDAPCRKSHPILEQSKYCSNGPTPIPDEHRQTKPHVHKPQEILRTRLSDSLNPSTSKPSGIPCYRDTLRLVAKLNSRVDTKVLYKRKMDIWEDPRIGVGLNGDELQQLSRMVHEAIGSMFKKYKYNPSTDEYTQKALHALRRTIRHYWKGELSLSDSLIIDFARGEPPG